jgi:ferritin
MLISKAMNAALNEQIGNEFQASLQYVAIAAYFAEEGLNGFSALFFKQADEEREHALRLVRYILDTGGHVAPPDLTAPQHMFKSAREAVELALTHEKRVTDQINRLVETAIREGDHITKNMLDWFVHEQLEEVSSMENLLKIVTRAGENNLLLAEHYYLQHRGGQPGEKAQES